MIIKIISAFLCFFEKKIYFYGKFFEAMMTDLTYLQQMTGNDGAMMKEMIEMFLHQLAEMQEEFDVLVKNKNWFELSRLAHKIKSSALVMGIEQMVDEMKELEQLAKEGKNIEKYPDSIARCKTMTHSIEAELNAYLDSYK